MSNLYNSKIKMIECPRDAMQGWKTMISTEKKISYLNSLLKVGFDTLDCGSFVSPKAIPQMADTRDVLRQLNIEQSISKLLVIVANTRGAEEAVTFDNVTYLGFPFSISETFQQRNTNSSLQESIIRVEEIQELCIKNNKQLVVYLSMAGLAHATQHLRLGSLVSSVTYRNPAVLTNGITPGMTGVSQPRSANSSTSCR